MKLFSAMMMVSTVVMIVTTCFAAFATLHAMPGSLDTMRTATILMALASFASLGLTIIAVEHDNRG